MDSLLSCVKSEDEHSDNELTIITESPKTRKSRPLQELNVEEKAVIEDMGKSLEQAIEQKAAKSNLTAVNIKSILKQVVTNEHVLAFVRKAECPDSDTEPLYEPKLTRAKRRLLTTNDVPLPWLPPKSETGQKLIDLDLDDDSSDDEYVPAEEESEDDPDSSVYSETDIRSVSPCNEPVIPPESPNTINWSEDGIFKIPPLKPAVEVPSTDEANIALRTRSKLSLSTTPLEVIEAAFIPPDFTLDMYDVNNCDDDWVDFLAMFRKPLDEVAKPTEDEDHDPEYNILADESINEIDTEELRADKAVTVSKKELNALFAELFDSAFEIDVNNDHNRSSFINSTISSGDNLVENTSSFDTDLSNVFPRTEPACKTESNFMIEANQKLLLEQQMCQHIQMLTQSYLLTFQHPAFHGLSQKVREFLLNLILLAGSKETSAFKPVNLEGALKLVDYWENQFALNTDEIKEMKQYICKVEYEGKQSWAAGTEYIVTFPTLILNTISNSDIFIYPSLLPRIPFISRRFQRQYSGFSNHEDELLAIGLEQFIPHLAEDLQNLDASGNVSIKRVSALIVNYMMPCLNINQVRNRIFNLKNNSSGMNPVKYYFQYKKAPVTMHYVVPLETFGIVPPCKRSKNMLPLQWRNHIFPEDTEPVQVTNPVGEKNFRKIVKPPHFNKYAKKNSPESSCKSTFTPLRRNFLRKPVRIFSSTPQAFFASSGRKLDTYFQSPRSELVNWKTSSCIGCLKFNSSIFKKMVNKTNSMEHQALPSMPALSLSIDSIPNASTDLDNTQVVADLGADCSEVIEPDSTVSISTSASTNVEQVKEDAVSIEVPVSATKNTPRKSMSCAEKRKAKLCKEYNATIGMLTPEDPQVVQERAQSYANAYFEKAQQCLSSEDYEQFMEILNSFNDGTTKVADLYRKMEELLANKHQDLLDEFLTFLTSSQAKDVGKLILYYKLKNMTLFLHKLERYFKDQPAHIRKIYRCLTDLGTSVDVTMDRVKNTILPLLKGNGLLIDWFLQIFPNEPPPKSLLNGPWELLDIRPEFAPKDLFETVTIPNEKEISGGPNCICFCHQQDIAAFKARQQHCTSCGLKFVQGRVYVQTDKGLRLANVSFPGSPDVDHNLRLNCPTLKKGKQRCDTSPSKQLLSPTKENLEELRHGCDSEDETYNSKKRVRSTRSPRKRKRKPNEKPEKNKRCLLPKLELPTNNVCDEQEQFDKASTSKVTFKDDDCDTAKQNKEDNSEWDCNASIESVDLRHSPDHSAESESEFCEESSQDNINTETDDTAEELESGCNSPVHSENSNGDTIVEPIWTREEDKIILETVQKMGNNEETFVSITNELVHRKVADIKDRFKTLISLLQKLMSESSDL